MKTHNSKFQQQKSSLLHDDRGLSTVEYVILLAVIVVGCVGIWNNIGSDVEGHLTSAEKDIKNIGAKNSDSGGLGL